MGGNGSKIGQKEPKFKFELQNFFHQIRRTPFSCNSHPIPEEERGENACVFLCCLLLYELCVSCRCSLEEKDVGVI
uniref:Putative ovule protein n=1 Tax=Solanum chacoense TaxID=4108 RepID=A0A0V0GIY4_SOLCH